MPAAAATPRPKRPTGRAARCSAATTRPSTWPRGACPPTSGRPSMRSTASCAARTRSSTAPARPPTPAAAPRGARRVGGRARARARAAARSEHPVIAALVDAGRRHDLPLGELSRLHGLDARRLRRAACGCARASELDAYMNGSAAAVGRIMAPLLGAPPRRREDGRAASASPSSSRTSSATSARTGRWTASTCPACRASDAAGRRGASDAFRARVAVGGRAARAALFAETGRGRGVLRPAMRRGMRIARAVYGACSTASSASASTCSAPARAEPVGVAAAAAVRARDASAPPRAARSARRLDGARADVLVCGASFAGLAVARELAGAGADVLRRRPLRDRRARDLGVRGADAVAARDGRRGLDPPASCRA